MKELTREQAIKAILKEIPEGMGGLPKAIQIYNMLSANGFYALTKKDIKEYFN